MREELDQIKSSLTDSVLREERITLPRSGVSVVLKYDLSNSGVVIDRSVGMDLSPDDMAYIRSCAQEHGFQSVRVYGPNPVPQAPSLRWDAFSGRQKFYIIVAVVILSVFLFPTLPTILMFGAIGWGLYHYYQKEVVNGTTVESGTAPAPYGVARDTTNVLSQPEKTGNPLLDRAYAVDQVGDAPFIISGVPRDVFLGDIGTLVEFQDQVEGGTVDAETAAEMVRDSQERVDRVFKAARLNLDQEFTW